MPADRHILDCGAGIRDVMDAAGLLRAEAAGLVMAAKKRAGRMAGKGAGELREAEARSAALHRIADWLERAAVAPQGGAGAAP